jgi:hypothetical protein
MEQVKGALIKFCLNKIIPRLEKPETYSVFTADYVLYPLYMQIKAGKVARQSYTATRTLHRNFNDIKQM